MLGCAEGTVKSRCSRGRARLAELLGDLAPGPAPDGRRGEPHGRAVRPIHRRPARATRPRAARLTTRRAATPASAPDRTTPERRCPTSPTTRPTTTTGHGLSPADGRAHPAPPGRGPPHRARCPATSSRAWTACSPSSPREREERLAPVVDLASRRPATAASLLVAAAAVVVVGVGIARVLPDHGGGDARLGRRGDLDARRTPRAAPPTHRAAAPGAPAMSAVAPARRPPAGVTTAPVVRIRSAHFGADVRRARTTASQEQPPGLRRRTPRRDGSPGRRPRRRASLLPATYDERAGVPGAASAGRGHPGRRPLPVRRHRPTPVDHAHHAVAGRVTPEPRDHLWGCWDRGAGPRVDRVRAARVEADGRE